MTYGVTSAGFVKKPLEQIKEDVAGRLRSGLGAGLNLTTGSAIGVTYLIFCEALAQMWELGEAVYASWDPDAVEGASQDNIAAITGTFRDGAKKSVVTATVTTDRAVSVPAQTFVVSVDGDPSARFMNTVAIETAGADDVQVIFEAEEPGPTVANPGTLTVIETLVSGIVAVTNPTAATVGSDIESSVGLRARREDELDAVGSSTVDSVRAKLLKVPNIVDAVVFENKTADTDAAGRPPHAIHAVVFGDSAKDSDVAQALWNHVAGGIETHGSQSGVAIDSRNKPQTVHFDRTTTKNVYLEINVDVLSGKYPENGDDQIAHCLTARGNALGMGKDVIAELLKKQVWAVPGVHDITGFRLGFSAAPTGTANLSIEEHEISRFEAANVVVTSNSVTPT